MPSDLPQHVLEAQRLARGWSRPEVSARIDALYQDDQLGPPGISPAELCHWEHGQRPNEERIEYLCRLYETRPDRLGYGVDFSAVDAGHLARSGLSVSRRPTCPAGSRSQGRDAHLHPPAVPGIPRELHQSD